MTIYIGQLPPSESSGSSGITYLYKEVIKDVSDFPATLNSQVLYEIDGKIDMGTRSLEVPSGGISIRGLGLNISSLYSTEDSYQMFTSSVGGSGDILFKDIAISASGASSQVFDLVSATGFDAFEFDTVNWQDCTSLGEIDNYRQGFETGTGRFGGTPSLTLTGVWLGGYRLTSSIVRNLDSGMTDALFKAGAGFTMSSRFLSDVNCDLPTNASFADFATSNFTAPSLVQMQGCIMTRDGNPPSSGDNSFFPNLDPEDLVCRWRDNEGLRNTFEGGLLTVTSEVTTVIVSDDTYYDLAGVYTASNLQHFSSVLNGTLQNDGINPIEYTLKTSLLIDGGPNDNIGLKIVKWNNETTSFEDVFTYRTVVDSLIGSRDVAKVFFEYPVSLSQGDYVKLQIANLSDTSNVTAESGGYISVQAR